MNDYGKYERRCPWSSNSHYEPGWGPGRARVPCVHDPAFLGKIWKDLKAQVGHHQQFSIAGLVDCYRFWKRRGHPVIGFLPPLALEKIRQLNRKTAPQDLKFVRKRIQSGSIAMCPAGSHYD